jgi:hypothetical protein
MQKLNTTLFTKKQTFYAEICSKIAQTPARRGSSAHFRNLETVGKVADA